MDKEYTAGEAKAWLNGYDQGKKFASKEWVGLTDEEIRDLYAAHDATQLNYAWAIEAKLREKNA